MSRRALFLTSALVTIACAVEPTPISTTASRPLTAIEDVVVYGQNSVRIEGSAAVLAGDVAAEATDGTPYPTSGVLADGARVSVGAWTTIGGDIYAATAMLEYGSELVDANNFDRGAFVDGVFYNGLLRGGVAHPMTAPPAFPSVPPVTAGVGTLTVPANTTYVLAAANSYDLITIETGATLQLQTGAHQVGSLVTASNATVRALGVVDLRIADALVLDVDSTITTTTGLSAGDFRVDVLGMNSPPDPLASTRAVDLGDRTTARMILSAPNGTVRIGLNGLFTGAVLARDVLVDYGATVQFEDGRNPYASDAPVAYDDTFEVSEDHTLNVGVPGVMTNDYDPNSDPLTATLLTTVANGTLTLNADGSLTYTPNTNFTGTDSFTYRVSDGALNSSTAVVTIVVDSLDDTPQIISEPDRATFVGALWTYAVVATDADTNDTLTYALESGAPSGLAIDSTTGVATWTPVAADVGTHVVGVRVTDSAGLFAVQNRAVVVTATPEIDRFAIYGGESVLLSGGGIIKGDLGAALNGGGTVLGSGWWGSAHAVVEGYISGGDVFGHSVALEWGSTAQDVYTNWLVYDASSSRGDLGAFPVMPAIPATATVAVSGTLTVPAETTPTIASGSTYATITIGASACLLLEPGTHHAGSIFVGEDGCLAALGPVSVYINDTLTLDSRAYVGMGSGANLSAHEIEIFVHSSNGGAGGPWDTPRPVTGGFESSLHAHVRAPNGTVVLGNRSVNWGSFAGRHVHADLESFTIFEGAYGGAFAGPPVFLTSEVTTVPERATYAYDADAIDYDPGDLVSYRLISGPPGMTVATDTGIVTWPTTSADLGAHTVILRAEDLAGNFSDQAYTLTVTNINDAPSFVSTPVTIATASNVYVYDALATDPDPGDALTYSLDSSVAGMTIDAQTGRIDWTPSGAQVGLNAVTVRATDLGGLFATQSFDIDVASGNQAPTIVSTPITVVSADSHYAYDVDATDPDTGDTVVFTLTQGPYGMSVDAQTGLLLWPSTVPGDHPVTVVATDIAGLNDSQTYTLSVAATNHPPQITSTPPSTAIIGTAWSYDVDAQDPDPGDTIGYAIVTAPSGSSIVESSGVLTWSPTTGDLGSAAFVVRAQDQLGAEVLHSFTVVVQSPPSVAPVAAFATARGNAVTSFHDGARITYITSGAGPNAENAITVGPNGGSWRTTSNSNEVMQIAFVEDRLEVVDRIVIQGANTIQGLEGARNFEIAVSTSTAVGAAFTTVLTDVLPLLAYRTEFTFPPVRARQVRLTVVDNYGHAQILVPYFEVQTRPRQGGLVSLIEGGAQVIRSTHPTNAERAFDYNVSTAWAPPETFPQSITLQLATSASVAIDKIQIGPENAGESVRNFELRASAVGSADEDFTTVVRDEFEVQGSNPPAGTGRRVYNFAPVHAQFIQLVVFDDWFDGLYAPWVNEVRIFSSTTGGLTVAFDNETDPSDTQTLSYLWEFGDGLTSNEVHPMHTYAAAGTYVVSLTVTDDLGQSDSTTMSYTALAPPTADFAPNVTPVVESESVTFVSQAAASSGAIVAASWTFGHLPPVVPSFVPTAGASPILSPTIGYNDDMLTTVEHRVLDSNFLEAVAVRPVNVIPRRPILTGTGNYDLYWGEVWRIDADFTDNPTDMASIDCTWDFGDGSAPVFLSPCRDDNQNAVVHAYDPPGDYVARLTSSDQTSASYVEIPIRVHRRPTSTVIAETSTVVGSSVHVVAYVVDEFDGRGRRDGLSMTFDSGSTSVSVTTDSTGRAAALIPFVASTPLPVTVTFAGNADYEASSSSYTFTTYDGAGVPSHQNPRWTGSEGSEFFAGILNTQFGGWIPPPREDRLVQFQFSSRVPTVATVHSPSFGTAQVQVQPGAVTQLNLPAEIFPSGQIESRSEPGGGYRITAPSPISVTQLQGERFALDSALLIPSTALGTDYVAASWPGIFINQSPFTGFNARLTFIGINDNTSLTITPNEDLFDSTTQNQTTTFLETIGRLGLVELINGWGNRPTPYYADPTGARISGNAPFAFYGGHGCAFNTLAPCNGLLEQLPPTASLGRSFLVVPFANRNSGSTVRVVAAFDNTNVNRNGSLVATLQAGEVYEYAQLQTDYDEITTTQASLVYQVTLGVTHEPGFVLNDPSFIGDPTMVTVVPTEQFGQRYTFQSFAGFAALDGATPDPIDFTNYITIVVPTAQTTGLLVDEQPVSTTWTVVGGSGYSATHVAVGRGSHTLRHVLPHVRVGAYSYGWDVADAYAHPAGMQLARLYGSCLASTTSAGDGQDNDCDATVDEELANNLDDDGDGLIDEDLALELPTTGTAPLAFDQSRMVVMDTPSPGIVMGAFDADGDALRWDIISLPANGALGAFDGTKAITQPQAIASTTDVGPVVRYVPNIGFEGTDIFTFRVSDATSSSNTATVTVTVRRPNTRPVITSSSPDPILEDAPYTYQLTAVDPDPNETLTFGVYNAPNGLTVTPGGLATWTPNDADVGDHPVSFSVTDSQGSEATEFLFLTVVQVPEAPQIQGAPATVAYANALYTASVSALDPDHGAQVTFGRINGPAGLSIHHLTGAIMWSPLPAQVGAHNVTLRATDETGLYTELSYTINVRPTNTAPTLASTPPTTGAPFFAYAHQLVASDPDAIYGDTTSFTLVSGPTGLTVGTGGLVDWTPTTAQLGTHQVAILLTDTFGAATPAHWFVHVRSQNHPPRFASAPVQAAYDGAPYAYPVAVADPDPGDTPTLALVSGPTGMTLSTNTVSWTPATTDVGRGHAVSLSATDRESVVTTQDFVVYVSGSNSPPSIDSQPVVAATQGAGYLYQLLVSDPNPLDTFTTDFPVALAGMSATPAGTITWTPTPAQIGAQPVQVRVTDRGGLSDSQAFSIDVANVNDPPSITSTPPTTADENQPYTYVVTVSDPDPNDTFTLSFDQSPPGMQLDPATNTITYTPLLYDVGFHTVVIRVRDAAGATNTQTYTLTVRDTNDPPQITSTPPLVASQGEAYRYVVVVSDPDTNDTHTFQLDTAPAGMTIDALSGVIDFTATLAQVGTHAVTLRVLDGQQATDSQSYTLTVEADTTAPVVTVSFTPPFVDPGQASTVEVVATDNVAVSSIALTIDGNALTLDANNRATVNTTAPGFHEAIATATDPAGNQATGMARLGVRDSADVTAPVAQIESPVEDAIVTEPTDIIGTVTDDNLLEWRLTATPSWAASSPMELATGTSSVTSVVLGTFDPTLHENGLFMLRLEATDINGAVTTSEVGIRVEGNMKIGVFTLSFVDLAIPVSGIPITVTRTYDSRVKTQEDFGYGWSLDVSAGRYMNNRTPGEGWTITNSPPPNSFPCAQTSELAHHRTEIRLSDQEYYSFRPTIPQGYATVGGCAGQVTYVQDGGSTPGAALQVIGNNNVFSTSGSTDLLDDQTLTLFDPQQVRLTTYDGRIIDLDLVDGVTRMEDRNGNEVFVTPNGIIHESGKSIVFTRDGAGRIQTITDPLGHTLDYAYDGSGDLVSFTDQEGHATTFTYRTGHYLENIINPLGVRAVRSEYDATGRLVATIDADGNRIEMTHDLATRRESIRNRVGETTHFDYDARGNVVQELYPDGASLTRTFDADDNVASVTDELGRTTSFTYDTFGHKLTETNPLTETSTWTYDAAALLTSVTDPRGAVTTYVYDARRNLRFATDAEGHSREMQYLPNGQVQFERNERGFTRTYQYDPFGNVTREVDERGVPTLRTYDANGVLLTETTTRAVAGQTQTLVTTYTPDAMGRTVRTDYPDGAVTRTVFDVAGRTARTIDELGRSMVNVYDAQGRRTTTTYPDGTTQTLAYDPEGRITSRTDREGRVQTFEFDNRGRQWRTTFDGASTTQTFDVAGQLTATTDRNGNTTTFVYDAAGRQTVTRDPLLNETQRGYDGAGQLAFVENAKGQRTTFQYDLRGLQTRITNPDTTFHEMVYDAAGNLLARHDEEGNVTSYTYDAANNLVTSTDPTNNTWTFAYDELGNRTGQTDPNSNITSFAFDERGREVQRTLPDTLSLDRTYDARGNIRTKGSYSGLYTTTYDYDTNDRVTVRAATDIAPVTFTYTAEGRRDVVTDHRGATSYGYDGAGRLAAVGQPAGDAFGYVYDANGNLVSKTVTAGNLTWTETYTYSARNEIASVTVDSLVFTLSYDATGQMSSLAFPNGLTTTYTYDGNDRLASISTSNAQSQVVSSYAYTRYPDGQIDTITEADGTLYDYDYDAANRLTQATVTDGAGALVYAEGYAYDAAGNRSTRYYTPASGGPQTYAYSYDPRDRIQTDGIDTYTFDADGRMVSRSGANGFTLGWNSEDRLLSIQSPQATTTNTYDGDGNWSAFTRVPVVGTSTSTRLVVDTQRGLSHVAADVEATTGTVDARYVRAGDVLIGILGNGENRFVHRDHIGSVRALSDLSAVATDGYMYGPFGDIFTHQGNDPNRYLFAGERFLSGTSLGYNRARWLAPATGRFVSIDPHPARSSSPDTIERYGYAANDPVRRIDPHGESAVLAGELQAVGLQGYLRNINLKAHAQAIPAAVAIMCVVAYTTNSLFAAVTGEGLAEGGGCGGVGKPAKMRAQLQHYVHGAGTDITISAGLVTGTWDRGVTVVAMNASLAQLYALGRISPRFPSRYHEDLWHGVIHAGRDVASKPPLGIPTGLNVIQQLLPGGWRIDIDSLAGSNLRWHR